ncbi:MAG: TIGR03364 family FAD-dependent oxidoreductase [Saprospiraceae bacterium]
MSKTAIVIGSGIIGIATAYTLLQKGFHVTVLEKNMQPVGASIRNFGMIWPIGQPSGEKYQLALRSKEIWNLLSKEAGFELQKNGSLFLAYHQDEKNVLLEFIEKNHVGRNIQWLTPMEVRTKSEPVNPEGLLGGMHSPEECLVDPRDAIYKLIQWLQSLPNCAFHFNSPVHTIQDNICIGPTGSWQADKIFICSGSDIAMLCPGILEQFGMLCELQMMRTGIQPDGFKLGPSLCGGLTLSHYPAFKEMKSLGTLLERFQYDYPDLLKHGIHVMAAQYESGEVTLGDSHEYGLHFDPFIIQSINDKILNYLRTFCKLADERIQSNWKGTYFKLKGIDPYLIHPINEYTTLHNGFGGLGMTLSFGVMEKELAKI